MGKKPKKRTDTIASEELIEARLAFVRGLVAEGLPNITIIDMCREHGLFETGTLVKAGLTKRPQHIARNTVREHYLYRVKQELRTKRYTAEEEVSKAYNRLTRVIEIAFTRGEEGLPFDLRAVIAAQKEIDKMLGLRMPEQVTDTATHDNIRDQMQAMVDSIGLPKENTRTGEKKEKVKKVGVKKKARKKGKVKA